MTSRFWCITVHKINDEDVEDIFEDETRGVNWFQRFFKAACESEERIAYFVGQFERGGNSGRLHLQCYLELRGNGGARGSAIRGMLGLGGTKAKRHYAWAYPTITQNWETFEYIQEVYRYHGTVIAYFIVSNMEKG